MAKEKENPSAPEVIAKEEEFLKKVQEKADAIIEEAKLQAQAIIDAAKETAEAKEAAGAAEEAVNPVDEEMEEYVTVKLFKDNGKYKDDVFVAVNGEGCNIPRGIPVKIKRKFALVLEQSDLQDYNTVQFMNEEARKFEEETKLRNL